MNIWEFLKDKQKVSNLVMWCLALAVALVLVWGITRENTPIDASLNDGIEQIDLNKVYLSGSGVEIDFSDVILSSQEETRYLVVSKQTATVTMELTDRLIEQLDFDFMKKTQSVSYTGTGYFAVDLHTLRPSDITVDEDRKTVTIRIGHAYLQAVDIDPSKIIIDEVKEGLLAWGDIKLTMKDYSSIEKELRTRLEGKYTTVANVQRADDNALRMVKAVYEPVVKAIDSRYDVIVEFR